MQMSDAYSYWTDLQLYTRRLTDGAENEER